MMINNVLYGLDSVLSHVTCHKTCDLRPVTPITLINNLNHDS
jgi:hypothetical protein